jgi:hypothetical protein
MFGQGAFVRLVLRPPRWWWIAIAYAHERRRDSAQTLRLATECDLPIYGLGDEWQGSRDVRIGFCHGTVRRGRLGSRVQDGPVVVDEIAAHHEAPEGGRLIVTSHRQTGKPMDTDALLNNFRSISWVIDQQDGAESGPIAQDNSMAQDPIGQDNSHGRSASPSSPPPTESGWIGFDVLVDGVAERFERWSIAGHWFALGTVSDRQVSIEGHGVVADSLILSRVSDPTAWVSRPDSPATSRGIVELGDRLGDLIGLP